LEHGCSQAPQLMGSAVTSTQTPAHNDEVAPEHPVTHDDASADAAQRGAVLGQAEPQPPQLAALVRFVSHPCSGLPLQCVQPGPQDERANAHWPDGKHVTGPLMCGSAVQSCPQAPQLCSSSATQPASHRSGHASASPLSEEARSGAES
jgi:hypothetical protein